MYLNSNNDQNKDKKYKGRNPLKYIGMMGVCCLLPTALIGILSLLQISGVETNRLITSLSSLICPIMMVVMMISMFRNGKNHNCCSQDKKEEVNQDNK